MIRIHTILILILQEGNVSHSLVALLPPQKAEELQLAKIKEELKQERSLCLHKRIERFNFFNALILHNTA